LIGQDASDIPGLGLTREKELGRFVCLWMFSSEPILFHQESELPPCFDKMIIDGRMLFLAGPRPRPIGLLLFKDSLRFRQLPQAMKRADRLP